MTTIAQTHHVSSDILAFLAASIETGDTEDDHDTSEDCNEEFEDIWIAQAAAAFGGGDSGSRSSKTKHTRSEEGEDDNEKSSQHVIHKDDHGKIIAFGVPTVPQTTMVSLKHNETRGADNEDAQTCSTRSCSSSEHSNANTSRTTSSSHRISFNEAVTVNHMENFRYILPKRERYSLWYSDIENIRMQIDYMNEKEQQAAQRDADDNGSGTTAPHVATTVTTTTTATNKDKTSMLTKNLKQKKTGFYPPGLFALTKNKAKSLTRKIFDFNDGRFAAPPPQHSEVLPSSLHGRRTVTNRAA